MEAHLMHVHRKDIPMAATLVREPFHRPGWIKEEKYDGWRMCRDATPCKRRTISAVADIRRKP
jgi:hypothetical protein